LSRGSAAESDRPDRNEPISLDAVRQRTALARLRADDQAALAELVSQYWERIVRYASRLLDDADAAHDVAQATFIRLWAQRAELEGGPSLGAFLYRTARSLAIDEYRRTEATRRGRLAFGRAGPAAPATPLEQTERAELTGAIDRALARLPARRREAFVLFHFHNLSYQQIAEIMEVRPQVVANYLSAALATLRTELSGSISDYLERPNG
jgi:RNA polymerase sigma-70 factor (ECF subfamily)